jgi:hypothetical protein
MPELVDPASTSLNPPPQHNFSEFCFGLRNPTEYVKSLNSLYFHTCQPQILKISPLQQTFIFLSTWSILAKLFSP